jgi:hypothetical protein
MDFGLLPHFLFDRLALGSIEAAATIGRAERGAPQSALAKQLSMRQAAGLTTIVALYHLLMIPALFAAHDAHIDVLLGVILKTTSLNFY